MYIIAVYDVHHKRVTKVRKVFKKYLFSVQNSVFECILDATQCVQLKASLIELIDEEKDSLRFYYLGNKYKTKVEHIGIDNGIAADDVLIL